MAINGQHIRDGFIAAIEELRPRLFLTLAFNHPPPLDMAEKTVIRALNEVQRMAFGKRYYKRPAADQIRGYGFPENVTSNLHYHLPLAGSDRVCEVLVANIAAIWRKLTVTGHVDVGEVRSIEGSARYVTKCVYNEWSLDHYIAYGKKVSCK